MLVRLGLCIQNGKICVQCCLIKSWLNAAFTPIVFITAVVEWDDSKTRPKLVHLPANFRGYLENVGLGWCTKLH